MTNLTQHAQTVMEGKHSLQVHVARNIPRGQKATNATSATSLVQVEQRKNQSSKF